MKPQVVVITGGTAGVGRAVARRFAADGAHIALLARGADGLAATSREIFALGGRALAISVDVADAAKVDDAADRIERELGPIDLWINNAMTTVLGRTGDVSAQELARVTDVTYHGTVWGTLAALRAMRTRNRGTIIQVGSARAYRSIPLQAAYCAAKHAVRGFTDSLRSELAHDGVAIELVMVQLPAINTPQFAWCENKLGVEAQPVPPIFQPELAADAIHFAARHPRREVFVGGPTIEAILGHELAPRLFDRFLARRRLRKQVTGAPLAPRASNLFAPVPGDHGAHGMFELRARRRSPLSTVVAWLGGAGVQALAIAVAVGGVATASALIARAR